MGNVSRWQRKECFLGKYIYGQDIDVLTKLMAVLMLTLVTSSSSERKRIQGHNPNVTSLIYMREHLHLLYIPPRGSEKIDSGATIINGAFT